MTAKEARESRIFVIENETVVEDNLYDFVMASAEKTTSPRGVENVLQIREIENEESIEYQVWDWGFRGQYSRMVESFETIEEAEDYIFNATYWYDFSKDDQRDTCYYSTFEEAQSEMIRMYADNNRIDIEVAESIFRHKECYKKIKAIKDAEHAKKQIEWFQKENERIQAIALVYAKMIEKIEGESYKQTCTRLSQAIGEKIEGKVFHAAVKIVRK